MRIRHWFVAASIAMFGLGVPGAGAAQAQGQDTGAPVITYFNCDVLLGEFYCLAFVAGDGPFSYEWYVNGVFQETLTGPDVSPRCSVEARVKVRVTDVDGEHAEAEGSFDCRRRR